ncbi:hypothetical protein KY342_05150 [Candidatus Woesearchaeota archaeon]|nr:hypothetical protein [Candidatus Woesearchaeota archaeon]
MAEPQKPREGARWMADPFSQDPVRAIGIIRARHKPLYLILHLKPEAVGDQKAYERLKSALEPYGGILDPYRNFTDIVGMHIEDFDKAKDLVREHRAGRVQIPGVRRISVQSLEAHACSNYEAQPKSLDGYVANPI